MTATELARLVRHMRTAQKAYFRQGRSPIDLAESKRLEKEVDTACNRVLDESPSLFGEGGPA